MTQVGTVGLKAKITHFIFFSLLTLRGGHKPSRVSFWSVCCSLAMPAALVKLSPEEAGESQEKPQYVPGISVTAALPPPDGQGQLPC